MIMSHEWLQEMSAPAKKLFLRLYLLHCQRRIQRIKLGNWELTKRQGESQSRDLYRLFQAGLVTGLPVGYLRDYLLIGMPLPGVWHSLLVGNPSRLSSQMDTYIHLMRTDSKLEQFSCYHNWCVLQAVDQVEATNEETKTPFPKVPPFLEDLLSPLCPQASSIGWSEVELDREGSSPFYLMAMLSCLRWIPQGNSRTFW